MPKNPSIHCDVASCKFNLNNEHYCSLSSINVGTHEPDPKVPECVDCESFQKKCTC